ncbi:eukaryotic translation initiation factor 3 subunit E [Cimex lectularius]|uniref:Eukaryotic translation initiation factor 3 subunit E n=1 Tax=Cimex lectularius TaxID=79782 RepID=A0A8I6RU08_CIMLE|nr:eukaryotic translation initiation factor 3 subunit E [Cimex lectularius]
MAKFDLTYVLAPYLDKHLVFPLLEFLSAKGIYNKQDILHAKKDIINSTFMVDYSLDILKGDPNPDKELLEQLGNRRKEVLAELEAVREAAKPITSVIEDDNLIIYITGHRDSKKLLTYLTEMNNFQFDKMDTLIRLSKCLYECGSYSKAGIYLYFYLLVMPSTDKNYLTVLWGKLASEILTQCWEAALEDLNKLKEFIDSNSFSTSLQSLQQRTWLIHWSLFIYFNHDQGRDLIIDMFLYRPNYLNAIQTMCPHILRYLSAAIIVNRARRNCLRDLVKVIQQESYTYRDPITEFLEHLYVNFDFESARQKLHECQEVVYNDFFLVGIFEDFVENARLMIFETFCRIHQCISISMLAEKLNMIPEDAECWIVNLIRSARLDAKIDSKLGHVIMGTQPLSPYQQLLEKVDTLCVKTEAILSLIDKKVKGKVLDTRWGGQDFN